MAVTFRGSNYGGSTTQTGDRSATFIPLATNELVVVVAGISGNTNRSPVCTDNQGGTYSLVGTALKNGSADTLSVFVRNSLTASTTSHTVTIATGSNTAGQIAMLYFDGAQRVGLDAIRSWGFQENQAAGGTPAPTLNKNALTGNPTIAGCFNGLTTGNVLIPNASWTERRDEAQSNPTTGVEVATRDSGFTGTTITAGGTSGTTGVAAGNFASFALELDSDPPPIFTTRTNPVSAFAVLPAAAILAISSVFDHPASPLVSTALVEVTTRQATYQQSKYQTFTPADSSQSSARVLIGGIIEPTGDYPRLATFQCAKAWRHDVVNTSQSTPKAFYEDLDVLAAQPPRSPTYQLAKDYPPAQWGGNWVAQTLPLSEAFQPAESEWDGLVDRQFDIFTDTSAGVPIALREAPQPMPPGMAVQLPTQRFLWQPEDSSRSGPYKTIVEDVQAPFFVYQHTAPDAIRPVTDTTRGTAIAVLAQSSQPLPVGQSYHLSPVKFFWQPPDTSRSSYLAAQPVAVIPPGQTAFVAAPRLLWQPGNMTMESPPVAIQGVEPTPPGPPTETRWVPQEEGTGTWAEQLEGGGIWTDANETTQSWTNQEEI